MELWDPYKWPFWCFFHGEFSALEVELFGPLLINLIYIYIHIYIYIDVAHLVSRFHQFQDGPQRISILQAG